MGFGGITFGDLPGGSVSGIPVQSNQTPWWQVAINAGQQTLGTVLNYDLQQSALQRGVLKLPNGTVVATTTGLPGQPVQANLGLSGLTSGTNWSSIIILLIVVALGWTVLRAVLR